MDGITVGQHYDHLAVAVYEVGETFTRIDGMVVKVLSRELESPLNAYRMEVLSLR